MRKQDYSILADILRKEIMSAQTWLDDPLSDTDNKNIAAARKSCAARVAVNFANRASVKRDEFLAACGFNQ